MTATSPATSVLRKVRRLLAWLWREGYGPSLLALSGLSVLVALTEGLGVGLLLPILQSLQTGGELSRSGRVAEFLADALRVVGLPYQLSTVLLSGLALYLLQAIVSTVRSALTARQRANMVKSARTRLFSNLLNFDLGFLHTTKIGDLNNTLLTETYSVGNSFLQVSRLVAAACILGTYVAAAVLISWQMTLLTFPLFALLMGLARPRMSYAIGQSMSTENDALNSVSIESLGGIREIKALGLEALSEKKFETHLIHFAHLDYLFSRNLEWSGIFYLLIVLSAALAMVYLAVEVLHLPPNYPVLFLIVIYRLAPRAAELATGGQYLAGYLASFEKATSLLAMTEQHQTQIRSGDVPFQSLQREILIKDIVFAYPGETTPVLRGLTLRILRGQTIAIVGASGEGKSTLLDLLLRFYDPQEGVISIDGVDLKQLKLISWRSQIGLVSQNTFLFNDSVLNNIRYGAMEAPREAVEAAARQAFAHEFIMSFPQGYDTLIGDRGVRLSGGQRQRLSLARAFLRHPEIIILDEATSNLDPKAEEQVQKAIAHLQGQCTFIIVSHRLATVQRADNIVVLEGGVIQEEGSHEALLQSGKRYAEYYRLQQMGLELPETGDVV